jgi:hypothetical protein
MERAIGVCREQGYAAVILVGDHEYYERFGFHPAGEGRFLLPGPVDQKRVLIRDLSDRAAKLKRRTQRSALAPFAPPGEHQEQRRPAACRPRPAAASSTRSRARHRRRAGAGPASPSPPRCRVRRSGRCAASFGVPSAPSRNTPPSVAAASGCTLSGVARRSRYSRGCVGPRSVTAFSLPLVAR